MFYEKNYTTLLVMAYCFLSFGQTKVFINEIHYENEGIDVNEGVEIAGPSGTDLSTYTLTLYNGKNNSYYKKIKLSGIIADQSNEFGTIFFPITGLQNGSPDGIALDNNGILIQFLSYEGTITASEGIANGVTSIDINVSENNTTAVGYSLQLSGTGNTYEDFSWSSSKSNSYKINGKQLTLDDIKNDLNLNEWPISSRSHVMKGGHYVYFNSPYKSCSFLTNKNFQTQMGRQIIFEAEKRVNPEFKISSDKIIRDNLFANIWKWQEFPFKDNMLSTMNEMIDGFGSIKNKLKKFNFKYFY